MIDAKYEKPFAETTGGTSAKPCPVCGKPAVFAIRPFCSKRCADIDLHRWLGGVYAIPAAGDPDEETDGQVADKN